MIQPLLQFEHPRTRRELAQSIIATVPDQFREGFSLWLTENWDLYRRFEEEAVAAASKRAHYSAYTVIEYLRHETLLRDQDAEFKLNQAWTSSVARLFAHLNPTYQHVFEFRVRKGGVVAEFTEV